MKKNRGVEILGIALICICSLFLITGCDMWRSCGSCTSRAACGSCLGCVSACDTCFRCSGCASFCEGCANF